MVVRIQNVGKWAEIEPGKVLELQGDALRKVRLEVNCPAPTRFDVIELVGGENKVTFLAVVVGHETLEFTVTGEAHVAPTSDEGVWFFTNDGDNVAFDVPGAVSFTKVMNRRARNPAQEMIMFKMEQNMLRRLEAQSAEIAVLRQAAEAKAAGADLETGEIEDEPSDSAAVVGGGASGAEGASDGGAVEPAKPGAAGSAGAAA